MSDQPKPEDHADLIARLRSGKVLHEYENGSQYIQPPSDDALEAANVIEAQAAQIALNPKGE